MKTQAKDTQLPWLKNLFSQINGGLIARINGVVLLGLGLSEILPLSVDFFEGFDEWKTFLFSMLLTVFAGTTLYIFGRKQEEQVVKIRDAFLITTTCWLTSAAFSSVPLMETQTHLDFTHAFFESVSGLTSTGSSVINNLDSLPPGINLWRALLQWFGGLGIIVLGIAIFPLLQIGGMQLFRTESSDTSEKVVPKAATIALSTFVVYFLLTLACMVLYFLAGMSFFDATLHAMTTLSTGGFSNHDASLGFFHSAYIEWIAIAFMALGSFPFVVYILMLNGRFSKFFSDQQIRTLLVVFTFYSLCLWSYQMYSHNETGYDALRHALFNTVNILSTTGYTAQDHTHFGDFYMALIFTMMFLGGATGSTASGIKVWRFIIINSTMRRQIKRIIYPRAVMPVTYENQVVSEEVIDAVFIFFISYVCIFFVGAMAIGLSGLNSLSSFSASIAALGNIGPGLGELIGPATNFSSLPTSALWTCTALMLIGRLEIMNLLILLLPKFWRA